MGNRNHEIDFSANLDGHSTVNTTLYLPKQVRRTFDLRRHPGVLLSLFQNRTAFSHSLMHSSAPPRAPPRAAARRQRTSTVRVWAPRLANVAQFAAGRAVASAAETSWSGPRTARRSGSRRRRAAPWRPPRPPSRLLRKNHPSLLRSELRK